MFRIYKILVVVTLTALTSQIRAQPEGQGSVAASDQETPATSAQRTEARDDDLSLNIPSKFEVRQNYPNPFNAYTTIEYDIPTGAGVYAVIYNSVGRHIKTLENSLKNPGRYRLEWDGRNDAGQMVSSGVYFYVLVADVNYDIHKMVLMK